MTSLEQRRRAVAPQLRLVISPAGSHLRWDLIALRYSGRVCRSVAVHTGTAPLAEPLTTERDCLVAVWRAAGELLWPEGGGAGFVGMRLDELQALNEGRSEAP